MNIESLADMLVRELQNLYASEQRAMSSLAAAAKTASTQLLRQTFLSRSEQSKARIQRLEEIFTLLMSTTTGKNAPAMAGLIAASQEILKSKMRVNPLILEAALGR